MLGIKIPQQDFVLKMQGRKGGGGRGGPLCEGGVFAGHYGIFNIYHMLRIVT